VRAWVADSTHRLVRGRLVRSPPHPSRGPKQDVAAFGNVFDSCNVLSRYIGMAVLDDLSGFEFEDGWRTSSATSASRTSARQSGRPTRAATSLWRRSSTAPGARSSWSASTQGRSGARSSRSSTRRSRRSTSTVRNAGWSSRPAGSRTLLKSTLIDSSRTTTPSNRVA